MKRKTLLTSLFVFIILSGMALSSCEEKIYTPLGEGNEVVDPSLDTQLAELPEDIPGEPSKVVLEAEIQRLANVNDIGGLVQVCWRTPKRKFYCEVAPRPALDVKPDPNCETIFQAASVSKTVFAYIVMRLWDQGLIDFDRPLYEYTDGILDERFCNVYPDDPAKSAENEEWAKRLTARIVLSHGTGIENWVSSSGSASEEKIPFQHEPDTEYIYSGEGIHYLQRVVEHITGKGLEELAQQEVFEPLGMDNSSYIFLEKYSSTHAYGFNSSHEKKSQGTTMPANAAYSMRTNVKDFSKFVEALMAGTGLSHKAHEILFTPQRQAGGPEKWFGMGIRVNLNAGNDYGPVWNHSGSNTNFKCRFWLLPKQGVYCIYFTSSNNGGAIGNPLIDLLYPSYTGTPII